MTSTERRAPLPSVLQRCVDDVDAFEAAWGSYPLLMNRVSSSAFADILSLADVDRIVAMSARRPTVRMIADGVPVDATRYCTTLRLGGRDVDDVADPRKVSDQLARGSTLVLQSLHRTWPTVAAFVDALQHETGHPVQANGYLTPAGASGLAPHADAHDVIVLQLYGSKHWNVAGLGDVELSSGDSMYVPAGTVHHASTAAEASLHLTLGLIRVTYRDVVTRLLAGGPAQLDAPLPVGYQHGGSDARGALVETLDRVVQHLSSVDVDECLRTERQRRRRTPFRPGLITSMLTRDDLTLDRSLRWSAPAPLGRLAGPGEGWRSLDSVPSRPGTDVEVHIGDRVLTVPSVVLDALRVLQCRMPVRVADLPGLDPPSRLVLARRLVEETACVIEPHPDASDLIPEPTSHPHADPHRHLPGGTPCPPNCATSESPS